MDAAQLNSAIVTAISDSAIPSIDEQKVTDRFGVEEGGRLVSDVRALIAEAVAMPIVWGDRTLKEGVLDILDRFKQIHPELSDEALYQIGRCVGWNWR